MSPKGIVTNGTKINNHRYADDTVLIATSIEDLQELFDVFLTFSEHLRLSFNSKKTKVMVISKSDFPLSCQLHHGNTSIDQVSPFNYVGVLSPLTQNVRMTSTEKQDFTDRKLN